MKSTVELHLSPPKQRVPAFQASAFLKMSNSQNQVQILPCTAWSSMFCLLPSLFTCASHHFLVIMVHFRTRPPFTSTFNPLPSSLTLVHTLLPIFQDSFPNLFMLRLILPFCVLVFLNNYSTCQYITFINA